VLRSFSVLLVLVLLAPFAKQADAQEVISVPDDVKFVVQVDVSGFRKTNLGGKLLELTQAMAAEEFNGQGDELMAKLTESLGFNPLEEIRTLTLMGTDYKEPTEELRLVIQLGKTTGNIEGLLLALPGYASEEHGETTIHSAKLDNMHVYAAIQTNTDGMKSILASTHRADVLEMLTSTQGARTGGKKREISWVVPSGTFAQLQIIEFPSDVLKEGPPANIIKMLKDVSLTLGESGDDFSVDLLLTTSDDKRAEQLQQLIQGLKAMVSLFKDEIGDDEQAKAAMSLAEGITVERTGVDVTLHAGVPQELIIKLLREEMDLPL
jgi:hypothetical protein